MKRWALIIPLAAGLMLASCGSEPTPITIVATLMEVQVTRQVTQEVFITSTPEPTPAGMPETESVQRLEADATHTALPSSERHQYFQGDGLTLAFPADWEKLDFSENEGCQQPNVECLLWIGSSSNDGTNILLVGSKLSSEYDAEEYYALMTAVNEAAHPDAILEGPELFEINGMPAVRVIFTVPGSSAGEIQQRLQVSVVRGLDHFIITAGAPSAETFKTYKAELDEIVSSLGFTP